MEISDFMPLITALIVELIKEWKEKQKRNQRIGVQFNCF